MAELVEIQVEESILYDNVAKRDTTTVTLGPVQVDGHRSKRVNIHSTLDQAFTLTTEYSRDGGTTWLAAGTAKTIAASSNFQFANEDDTSLTGLALLAGQVRFKMTPSVAPTTGNLSIWYQGA